MTFLRAFLRISIYISCAYIYIYILLISSISDMFPVHHQGTPFGLPFGLQVLVITGPELCFLPARPPSDYVGGGVGSALPLVSLGSSCTFTVLVVFDH